MTPWSLSEAARVIEEVKTRSMTDREFRALALSDPIAALGKINPQPVPVGSVRFVESADSALARSTQSEIVAVLPDLIANADEMSFDELEAVAGGGSGTGTPPVGIS